VSAQQPIAGLRCTKAHPRWYGVHVELYAHRLAIPVPAGIGIAPPQRRDGAYVLGGACMYPIRTFEPTGVVVVDTASRQTLGALFAVWGQPLSRHRLAGFRSKVTAYVNGREWRSSPGSIPLRRHAEIVLEVAGRLRPRRSYGFPAGL
jgi:hypothetical protein